VSDVKFEDTRIVRCEDFLICTDVRMCGREGLRCERMCGDIRVISDVPCVAYKITDEYGEACC
jgi:hypothetical protein